MGRVRRKLSNGVKRAARGVASVHDAVSARFAPPPRDRCYILKTHIRNVAKSMKNLDELMISKTRSLRDATEASTTGSLEWQLARLEEQQEKCKAELKRTARSMADHRCSL